MKRNSAQTGRKVVLVAVTGMSPAVLSETVWALAHARPAVVPDEVVAITTTAGQRRILETMFGRMDGWSRLKKELRREGVDIRGKLLFGPTQDSIRVLSSADGSRNLDDIATAEDNRRMADTFLNVLRGYTDADEATYQVYASIAGGRKTMGALMFSCMTLLGRSFDHVLHVLVNAPFDSALSPEFLFPEKGVSHKAADGSVHRSEEALVDLIDLPFVRMRGLYRDVFHTDRLPSYARLVDDVQTEVPPADDLPVLRVDWRCGDIFVSEIPLKLSPAEFLAFVLDVVLHEEDLERRLVEVHSKGGANFGWLGDFASSSRFSNVETACEDLTKVRSSLRRKLAGNESVCPFVGRLVPRGRRQKPFYPSSRISADVRELHRQLGWE